MNADRTELSEIGKRLAEHNLDSILRANTEGRTLNPSWHFWTEATGTIAIASADPDEAETAADYVRTYRPDVVLWVADAWGAPAEDSGRPRDNPNRTEQAIVLVADRGTGPQGLHMVIRPYARNAKGVPVFTEEPHWTAPGIGPKQEANIIVWAIHGDEAQS